MDHLTRELCWTLGAGAGMPTMYDPREMAVILRPAVDEDTRTFDPLSPIMYVLTEIRKEICHWLVRRGAEANRVVHLPDAHMRVTG